MLLTQSPWGAKLSQNGHFLVEQHSKFETVFFIGFRIKLVSFLKNVHWNLNLEDAGFCLEDRAGTPFG